MARSAGLGRGLSALLEDSPRSTGPDTAGIRKLPMDKVAPNPDQPRRLFDKDALEELAQSISARGVLQPILVRPAGDGYQIIAGERRWRASQIAQLHEIPAIVRDSDDSAVAELAIIENVQREDLNALEEARAYAALAENFEHSQGDIAKKVGKSRSHVANLIRLLDLPEHVQQALLEGSISMGHARALIGHPEAEKLVDHVIADELSVRQTEALVRGERSLKTDKGEKGAKGPSNPDIAALERQLGDLLGLKVNVSHGPNGGKVQLGYRTLDQLDMICQRLSGEAI
ncbi:ParB/RepB/Spo0J family partition protein [Sphingomicrobium aestuariivivum]|uniref:ParB/RepB/Spo0J family partition protein n=1 Tax=Sphingomicrobium aestuariivivum TaxID=1582356 RepID=UPI001FD63BFA|nr:ParB/RepB/Spo0J family partition protein [Sphingomicrobium aestuariivivum]MCJ8191153.1 ParB/RepB/Spo0J family partition protein [Sphingomicrobium aestuariivivum]